MNKYINALNNQIVEKPKSFWEAEIKERELAKKNNTNTNSIKPNNNKSN